MGKINILTKDIYNRIAAGEVVDRPYSALKELVENSLDAGATEISIYIEKGGKQLIKVCDNGCGIEEDDMRKAFIPHATSKVARVEDLDDITTLGFRGEALASISSISKTEIVSATEGHTACRVVCEAGYTGKTEPAALDKGTEVSVHDLFYNTPVRAKFLKTDKAEEGDIQNFVSRFILGNPSVAFKYYADGKLKLQSFGNGLDEAVAQVYGAKVIPQCFKINAERNGIKIHGFIGNQNYFKPNKSYQSLFLNGRYIINNIINSAITNAYASYLMKRQYPFYVLFVDVPHDMVDVNVHPNKADVRFTDGRLIYGAVYSVISGVLDGTARAADFVVDAVRIPEIKSSYSAEQTSVFSSGEQISLSKDSQDKAYEGAAEANKAQIGVSDAQSVQNEAVNLVSESSPVQGSGSTSVSGAGKEADSVKSVDSVKSAENQSFAEEVFSDFGNVRKVPDENVSRPAAPLDKLFAEDKKSANKSDELSAYENYAAPDFVDREKKYPVYAYYSDLGSKNVIGVGTSLYDTEKTADFMSDGAKNQSPQKSSQDKIDCNQFVYKGNLFNTYLIYESGDGVYLVDQHAAHERLIYNRFKAQMADRNVPRQGMLVPYILSLTPVENTFMEENLSVIREMGFDIEPFGFNSYRVCEVPADLKDIDLRAFFDEIFSDIVGMKSIKMEDILKDKIAMSACKHAVKGGMQLTRQEADGLLREMNYDMGMKCPHGRPVAVKLTKYQIEKMFKRIV